MNNINESDIMLFIIKYREAIVEYKKKQEENSGEKFYIIGLDRGAKELKNTFLELWNSFADFYCYRKDLADSLFKKVLNKSFEEIDEVFTKIIIDIRLGEKIESGFYDD
ncbi:hypothetical protein MKX70_20165 [Paenibacillus sp. FSL R7-0312]|uniref:hypothetical protein n=1 Tax=Paenibacillus sp. FSL R7-0312 TaxID=2921682 RepID=UPI0030FA861C